MRKIPFVISDVFGNEKYSGNQLATFYDCDNLSSQEMQKIASEINFSETTFITSKPISGNEYDVRIFTPAAEIDFAGHPTLGTAFIIKEYLNPDISDEVILNLKVGKVSVKLPQGEEDSLWMKQVIPSFKETYDKSEIARMIGLQPEEIIEDFPVQHVSTGLPQVIIPVKNLVALKKVRIDVSQYNEFIKTSDAKCIFVFTPEGYNEEFDISVRVFPIYYGIPEDPATGSGNGCLAAYLVKHRFYNSDKIDLKVGQGFEINRPSVLAIKAENKKDVIDIYVGGKVIPVAEGFWY